MRIRPLLPTCLVFLGINAQPGAAQGPNASVLVCDDCRATPVAVVLPVGMAERVDGWWRTLGAELPWTALPAARQLPRQAPRGCRRVGQALARVNGIVHDTHGVVRLAEANGQIVRVGSDGRTQRAGAGSNDFRRTLTAWTRARGQAAIASKTLLQGWLDQGCGKADAAALAASAAFGGDLR